MMLTEGIAFCRKEDGREFFRRDTICYNQERGKSF